MNNTTDASSFIKLPYQLPPVWATQFAALLDLTFAALAVAGNVIFVCIVLLKKEIRTFNNALLVNLSATDIIAGIFVSVPTGVSYLGRGWEFGREYCIVHYILHPLLLSTSLWSTALVALNRYLYIAHSSRYPKLTNRVTITTAVLFAWLLPLAVRMAEVDGQFTYSPAAFRCFGTRTDKLPYLLLNIYLPSIVVVVCYVALFIIVKKSRNKVQSHAQNQAGHAGNKLSRQEMKMLLVVFAVFCLVLLGYLPFVVVMNVYLSKGAFAPAEVMVLMYPLNHVAGVLNPVLYGVNNRRFRKAYKDLLSCRLTNN